MTAAEWLGTVIVAGAWLMVITALWWRDRTR